MKTSPLSPDKEQSVAGHSPAQPSLLITTGTLTAKLPPLHDLEQAVPAYHNRPDIDPDLSSPAFYRTFPLRNNKFDNDCFAKGPR